MELNMANTRCIDLNCDMGEGMPNDALLMKYISSANIACGGHAGDTSTMQKTVDTALRHGVAIGAHPSYPDRKNFGRKDLLGTSLHLKDIPSFITEQVYALQKVCKEAGLSLHHVKPHGALYNRAAVDRELSDCICETILAIDPSLCLVGLSGSLMKASANTIGIRFISEVFADRTYQDDGTLTPRSKENALITSEPASLAQVMEMVKKGVVLSVNNQLVPIQADTVCLHGDGPRALDFAVLIRQSLEKEGIRVASG